MPFGTGLALPVSFCRSSGRAVMVHGSTDAHGRQRPGRRGGTSRQRPALVRCPRWGGFRWRSGRVGRTARHAGSRTCCFRRGRCRAGATGRRRSGTCWRGRPGVRGSGGSRGASGAPEGTVRSRLRRFRGSFQGRPGRAGHGTHAVRGSRSSLGCCVLPGGQAGQDGVLNALVNHRGAEADDLAALA